jgi:hypothetical protein
LLWAIRSQLNGELNRIVEISSSCNSRQARGEEGEFRKETRMKTFELSQEIKMSKVNRTSRMV